MQYKDKVIIVTGASTGLGRAIAVGCAQRGAKHVVVNCASQREAAEETATQVRAAGASAEVFQADVARDADCRALAQAAARYGRIDVLFNNAGNTRFAQDHANLDALSADDFQFVFAVNVVGPFQMIRAARTLLEASAGGAIVNTSSIAGVTGIGSSVAYAASKGALNTMTLSLARALAPKLRVNAICPGFIDTGWFGRTMDSDQLEQLRTAVAARTPLRVASKPEDIAASALFLGSDDARHITGETLIVDAGTHLGFAPLKAR
ncbi:MAG: SDR family oxidoreductase [Alphaproteobacteria bacterium]|nr:SDR family oxidoreductase [Alphaproteobacteria bacterium]